MPITLVVKVEGLAELKAALLELPKATARNVEQRVLLHRAQPIVDAAKAKAPVRTGRLRAAITATTTKPRGRKAAATRAFAAAGGGAAGRAAAAAAGSSPAEVFIGPVGQLPEAGQSEWGNRYQRPRPYLRPSWDAGKLAVLDGIKDDLWAEISKSAARLAKKRARSG